MLNSVSRYFGGKGVNASNEKKAEPVLQEWTFGNWTMQEIRSDTECPSGNHNRISFDTDGNYSHSRTFCIVLPPPSEFSASSHRRCLTASSGRAQCGEASKRATVDVLASGPFCCSIQRLQHPFCLMAVNCVRFDPKLMRLGTGHLRTGPDTHPDSRTRGL